MPLSHFDEGCNEKRISSLPLSPRRVCRERGNTVREKNRPPHEAARSSDDAAAKTYRFSGTRRGNVLTVAFAGNKRPDVSPSEIKSLVWNLVRKGNRELLRIKVFGKNYETNKYEDSFAYFESCDPGAKK